MAIGNPSLSRKMATWLEKIIRADSTELIDPLVADDMAIEVECCERVRRVTQ